LTVFGKFEPKNVVGRRVDPKKALPYVTTGVLSYVYQNPSMSDFSRRVRGKIKIKIKKTDWHKLWVACSPHKRNQLCKFLS